MSASETDAGNEAMTPGADSANPLLEAGRLPRFDAFEPAQIRPGIESLLAELDAEVTRLEAAAEPTWSGLVEPLEAMGDRLGFAWGLVGHLMGVRNEEALRTAHAEMQGDIVRFGLRQAQSRPLFEALERLAQGPEWARLDAVQQRIVQSLLREARHAGVGLGDADRARFNAIQEEMAGLATDFSNHVLDATQAFSKTLRDPAEIAGLPDSWRQLAAQNASEAGEEGATPEAGPWRVTLDAPSAIPFLEHADRRDLREVIYRAYIGRASDGALDNAPVIERILDLRQEIATLLGYADYASFSIDVKMAPSVEAVNALLEQLRTASFETAQDELRELERFAQRAGLEGPIQLWDVAYYAEKLREERFDYSEETLRPYFPLPRVLDGLFALAERLFGVRIEAADGETSVWHPDVRFFRVRSEAGDPIAAFFLDPFSRPGEKRGGAWMDECLGRSRRETARGEELRQPVAYLVCNQSPPVGDKPSLMSFDEVVTLFHEFGHGLQHMLTRVDRGLASGIRNIEWDAVELPSQFMENWCYHRETLLGLTAHFETGEPLPAELFDKIEAARTFRAASQMLRQLYFASIDLALHSQPCDANSAARQPGESIFEVQHRIAERNAVLPPLSEDRFLCSFGHIFAGGYAAGYYSYKWAEVLSADAFSAFEEAGLDDPRAVADTGRRFRDTVLSLGGGTPPMEVFEAFRGRPPEAAALLRHSGLAEA